MQQIENNKIALAATSEKSGLPQLMLQMEGNGYLLRYNGSTSVQSQSFEEEALEIDACSESYFSSCKENAPPTNVAALPNFNQPSNNFYTRSEYSASFSSLVISDYIHDDPDLAQAEEQDDATDFDDSSSSNSSESFASFSSSSSSNLESAD